MDNTLNDNWSMPVLNAVEELRKCCYTLVFLIFRNNILCNSCGIPCELKQKL